MEFELILSLIFQYTFLTAFGQKETSLLLGIPLYPVPYNTYCVYAVPLGTELKVSMTFGLSVVNLRGAEN